MPLTHLDVHPALMALVAVLLLAITLPLIGLQAGREAVSRRRAALVVASSEDPIVAPGSPNAQVEAIETVTRSEETVALDPGRRPRFAHRRRIGFSSLG